jgi:ABC-type transport system substrate-binding protein
MKRRRLLQGAAAAAVGAGSAAGVAASAAAAPSAPPPSRAGDAPGAPGTPAPRKVLRLAFATAETTLDPPQTNSDANTVAVLANILEAPLGYDYLARPVALVPRTAEALPEVSADGRTITLRIRAGIFFADDPAFRGARRELVAQDYVYTIKRFYDPQYNSGDLYLFENAKLLGLSALRERALKQKKPFDYDTEVEGLRALDRYTLRLVLGEPNPRFVYLLADSGLTGAVAREVVAHYGPKDIGEHPVGTGPFRLKSWRRASRLVLERNPLFRGERYEGTPAPDPEAQRIAAALGGRTLPLVDELVLDVIEEEQPRWLAFLAGTLGWIGVPPAFVNVAAPGGRLAPYLQKKGVTLQRNLEPFMQMSYFYMGHPLVGGYTPEKVALRRAIALAFDGPAYLARVMGGQGILAQSLVSPFTSGYDPAYRSEMSEHDPARAQALLDLHGYVDRNGDGFREQPDGQPLVLRMASAGGQRGRLASELWKRSMNRVGLRMEFELSTWPELLKKSRAGTLMMWGYGWSAGSPDGGFFLGLGYGPNASESNDARFQLPAYDRLFERQMRLPDGPEREAVMRQCKDMLTAYMPYKVHAHAISNVLVQPGVKNLWVHPFMRDFWRFVDVQAQT